MDTHTRCFGKIIARVFKILLRGEQQKKRNIKLWSKLFLFSLISSITYITYMHFLNFYTPQKLRISETTHQPRNCETDPSAQHNTIRNSIRNRGFTWNGLNPVYHTWPLTREQKLLSFGQSLTREQKLISFGQSLTIPIRQWPFVTSEACGMEQLSVYQGENRKLFVIPWFLPYNRF